MSWKKHKEELFLLYSAETINSTQEIHYCLFCGFGVSGTAMGTVLTSILTRHLHSIHQVPNYSCKLCEFVTNDGRSAINDHLLSNHNFERQRTFHCRFPVCGAKFIERAQVMDHVIMHSWPHDGQRFNVYDVTAELNEFWIDNYASSVTVRPNHCFSNDVNKRCITAACKHCDLMLVIAPSDDETDQFKATEIVHQILKEHHSTVHRRLQLMCCRCGLRVRELNTRLAEEHKRLCSPSSRRRSLCTHGKGAACAEWIDLSGSIQHYDVSVPGTGRLQRAASAEPFIMSEEETTERNRRKQKRPRQFRPEEKMRFKVEHEEIYKVDGLTEEEWMKRLKKAAVDRRKTVKKNIANENELGSSLMKDYCENSSLIGQSVYRCDLCGYSASATNQTHLIAILTRHLQDVHKLMNFSCALCNESNEKKEMIIHHLIMNHLKRQRNICPFTSKCDDIYQTYDDFSNHVLGHVQAIKSIINSPIKEAVIDNYPEFITCVSNSFVKSEILAECEQLYCKLCDLSVCWMRRGNEDQLINLAIDQLAGHIERDHHKKRFRCSECHLPVTKLTGATIKEHEVVCPAGPKARWVKYDLTHYIRKVLSKDITDNHSDVEEDIETDKSGDQSKNQEIRKFYCKEMIIECPTPLAPCLSVVREEAICNLCQKGYEYKEIAGHLSAEHVMKQYSCRFCSYQQDSVNDVRSHQLARHGPCYCLCELCHMEFRRKDELQKHLKVDHNTFLMDSFNSTTVSLNGRSKVNNQHDSAYRLINQLESPQLVKCCPKCSLVIISKSVDMLQIFKDHLQKSHGINQFQCMSCDFNSATATEVSKHFENSKKCHHKTVIVAGDHKKLIKINDYNSMHSCKRCCFVILSTNHFDPSRSGFEQMPQELWKHILSSHHFGGDPTEAVKLTSVVDIKSCSILARIPALTMQSKKISKDEIHPKENKKRKRKRNELNEISTNNLLELENLGCIFECDDCGFLIASSSTTTNSLIGLATRHVTELHLPRPYACAKCGAAWENREEVVEHAMHSHRYKTTNNNNDELIQDLGVGRLKQLTKLKLNEIKCDSPKVLMKCTRCCLCIIASDKMVTQSLNLLEHHLMRGHFIRKYKCTACGFQSNTLDGQDVYDHNQLCSIDKLIKQDFTSRINVNVLPEM